MKKPNILLVVMDSVRAKNMSLHGYTRPTTPFLNKFAEESVVYEQARAPGPNTLTSSASIFTGFHVPSHGLTNRKKKLRSGNTVWDTVSEEYGYDTGIFSKNPVLTELPVGLKEPFQEIQNGRNQRLPFKSGVDPKEFLSEDGSPDYREFIQESIRRGVPLQSIFNGILLKTNDSIVDLLPDAVTPRDITDGYFTDSVTNWIGEQTGPWAACINYMSAHVPYFPKERYNKWAHEGDKSLPEEIGYAAWELQEDENAGEKLKKMENLYDGCILEVDNEVKRLIRGLKQAGEFNNTFLIVMADHGEGFGEESHITDRISTGHGPTGGLHEAVYHVPLIAKPPQSNEHRSITDLASLTEFPQAVEAVINDEWHPELFIPGSPVVSVTPGIAPFDADELDGYVDDVSVFENDGKIVYENTSDAVLKHMKWKDRSVSLRCRDAQVSERVPETNSGVIESILRETGEKDLAVSADEEISQDTKQRLEDLGYV